MNIEQLKFFIAVYRSGNFVSVAKQNGVATSSVSRAISALEEKLNVRLFQRSTRKLSATEAGEQYFQKIEALIEELEIVHNELDTHTSTPSGNLRVSASVSFGQQIITPLLKGFCQQYPNIDIELSLSDSRVDLINEQFDVAIRHGALEDSNFIAKKLTNVRFMLVASPKYLDKTPPIVELQDLAQHIHISFPCTRNNKKWAFQHNNELKCVNITPKITVSTPSVIKECVKNDMGIGILADWIIKDELNQGTLVEVLPNWLPFVGSANTEINLVYPSRSFVPAKTAAFCEYLLEHVVKNNI